MRKCLVSTFLVLVLFGICVTGCKPSYSPSYFGQIITSADQERDASAQNNPGVMYEKGEGVQQNYKEAVNRFQKVADQGNAVAQNNLGLMHTNGEGVQQNYKEAVNRFQILPTVIEST
ncbi:MAG: sel1 repeat family protein [Endomicrobium sp.]|uniref:tetratricopeptide repeat protein n=1 Tax=Candidatus Endomicrobiellum pyrsonymphae TaxID=1408203 RepID=UPI00357951AC|nr:sel1 repeat family protein [Endomicrobium sp.]